MAYKDYPVGHKKLNVWAYMAISERVPRLKRLALKGLKHLPKPRNTIPVG